MLKFIITLAVAAGVFFHTSVADDSSSTRVESYAKTSSASEESTSNASAEVVYEYIDCEPVPEPQPPQPPCTKENEVYELCPPPCPFRTCGIDDRLVFCAPPPENRTCTEGKCRCAPGYFRDYKGNCVRWEECQTTCTKPNEIYDPCDRPCPARRCDFDASVVRCKSPPKVGDEECVVGCRCEDGFLRNGKGICVPSDQCSKKCNANEFYDPCPDCNPQTCSTVGKVFHCPMIPADKSDPRCKGACRCNKGYARNDNGVCVPISECNKCPGPNEYFSCGSACDNRCDSPYGQDNCNIQNIQCNRMCYCDKDYARDANGTCIPKTECPPKKCPGPHEYFSCGSACDNRCDSPYGQDNCNIQNIVCNQMCYCEKDYARDANGTCIPKTECPPTPPKKCPGPHEYFSCGSACDNRCDSPYGQDNCNIQNIVCNRMCYCEKDYARDANGICIPKTECPPTPQCKENEVPSTCINGGCQKKLCTDLNKPAMCVDPSDCIEGCLCAPGYLRNKKGVCVPTKQCDVPLPVCKANEEFSVCGLDGCLKRYCSDLDIPPLCRDTFTCNPTCECKEGYLRASFTNDTCVAIKDCPNYKRCGLNEQYVDCANGICRVQDCADKGQIRPCPPMAVDSCVPGCVCPEGFLKNATGTCVPEDQCEQPQIQCPENEVLSQCPQASCDAQTCAQAGQPIPCVRYKRCPGPPGCVCAPGYLRDESGKCIEKSQCPSCGGDVNAKPGCGNCNKRCSDRNNTEGFAYIEICYLNACDCREGYLLDDVTNKCVKPDKCSSTCPANEELVQCPEYACLPETCKEAGFPIACPNPGPDGQCPGKPRCLCTPGFLRNSEGVCIPKNECPSCGGDENAFPGCGGNCGRLCSNYNSSEGQFCPLYCDLNGCNCKPDYVFDSKTNKCVLPEKCPCGTNEEYSECSNGLCRVQSCADKGKSRPCPPMAPGSCIPGCVCPVGYLKNKAGKCVREDQCEPPPDSCPANERLVQCPETMCQPETCAKAGFPVACPMPGPDGQCPGKPRCICNAGYLRNSKGVCIPKEDCPLCGSDVNASPGCGTNCGRHCSNYNSTGPKICPLYCNLNGCDCKKNYVYDDNQKKCVLPNKCTPTCQANEEFSECSNAIGRPQTCANKDESVPSTTDKTACKAGCVCKKNYLRAANGTCIPSDQCPAKCPEGEIFDTCPPPQCDGEYCPRTRNDPQGCKYPNNDYSQCGKPRCVCGILSLRDRNTGKCIQAYECPPFKCDGPNESFNNCAPSCPGETCDDYLKNATCPRFRIGIVVRCKLACRCNEGYYRNSKNICVPASQCKSNPPPCHSTDVATTVNPTSASTCDAQAQKQALEQGNAAFTGKFLYEVVKSNPGKSVFMSAFSVMTPLAQLALYASGNTYSQLSQVLNVKDKSDIRCGYPALLNSVTATNGTILDNPAKIYVYKQGKISKSLENDSENIFRSKAENVDFNDGDAAAKTINNWVSNATRGKIDQLVDKDMFDSMTRLVLVNAIYFKGLWQYQFNPNNTKPRDFYVSSDRTIQVPTMTQKGRFNYAEISDPNVQVLELPYQDADISFLVILPKEKDGLLSVVEKLKDSQVLQSMIGSLSKQQVTMYIPKITKLETKIDLKPVLKALGISDMFDSSAQISGMTDPDQQLYVSAFVQKAFCTVNEEGAEATAANAVIANTFSLPIEYTVDADHPYIFIIKRRNLVLFTGVFAN